MKSDGRVQGLQVIVILNAALDDQGRVHKGRVQSSTEALPTQR